MAELSAGKKAWVTKSRNQTLEDAPARIKCPKCQKTHPKEKFGVRTFKNGKGEPVRFGMQSYCNPCRSAPSKKADEPKKTKKAATTTKKVVEAKKAVGTKVRRLLQGGQGEGGEGEARQEVGGEAGAAQGQGVAPAGDAQPVPEPRADAGHGGDAARSGDLGTAAPAAGGEVRAEPAAEAGGAAGRSGSGVLTPVPPIIRKGRITIIDAEKHESVEEARARYQQAGLL